MTLRNKIMVQAFYNILMKTHNLNINITCLPQKRVAGYLFNICRIPGFAIIWKPQHYSDQC